jgi:hypothetical protein
MSWSYKIFWAAATIASLSLAACGQMKETNNGRPAVQQPNGGAPAATNGSGPQAASSAQGQVANQLVKLAVTNITKSPIGGGEQGYDFSATVVINGAQVGTITTVQNTDTQANVDGFVGYLTSGNYVVTYAAKCDTISCDQYFITMWVTNISGSNGVNELQLGIMKDMNGRQINADANSDQVADTISGGKNMISLQSIVNLLQQMATN